MKKAEVSLKFASIKVALVLIVTLTLSMLSADCGWALSYEAEVLADNPTAYYRLGGDASNSHGSGEDGVASSGVSFGHAGALADGDTAAHFSGSDSYIQVADSNAALDLETGTPFTIEYWMNVDSHRSNDGNWHVVSRSDSSANASDAFIVNSGTAASPAHNVRFHTDGWAGGNHRVDSAANTVVLNEWTHVVGTYNGSNEMALYLNGQQVALVTDINRGPGADADAGNVYFGQLGNSPGSVDYPGGLDEVAFYDTVLSADRVLAHYNAASVVPEPTSLALLAMCLGGLLAWYRKR